MTREQLIIKAKEYRPELSIEIIRDMSDDVLKKFVNLEKARVARQVVEETFAY